MIMIWELGNQLWISNNCNVLQSYNRNVQPSLLASHMQIQQGSRQKVECYNPSLMAHVVLT